VSNQRVSRSMSTTQIPPTTPTSATPPPRKPDGGDLYDARYWESACRDIDEAPTLVIQLQDDLTHSRRRESFWISVVVHLLVVLLIVNSTRIAGLMPRPTSVLNANAVSKDKDLTYLELPPDQQTPPAKPPETNIISDKTRIATSKAPQIDRKELKKILDSSRPGRPGPGGAPQQPAAEAQAAPTPQPQQQAPPPPPPDQNLNAKLQTPALSAKDAFSAGSRYVGSATEQAARAAAGTRGVGVGGDNGDSVWAPGKGRRTANRRSPATLRVDFGPYLARVLHDEDELVPIPSRRGRRSSKRGMLGSNSPSSRSVAWPG
jgi:hypothetical protein